MEVRGGCYIGYRHRQCLQRSTTYFASKLNPRPGQIDLEPAALTRFAERGLGLHKDMAEFDIFRVTFH